MKIAIVVQGRFYAFDLAKELILLGHEVVVLTNYPKWAVKQFGISPRHVRSLWIHGVISRICGWLADRLVVPYPEAFLHRWFGRWAKGVLVRSRWDVVYTWSGVSEEALTPGEESPSGVHLLMRGSAHIRVQDRILAEEAIRVGMSIERPSRWMIEREDREYRGSRYIVTLSTFARDAFLKEGIPADKLMLLPLGSDVRMFRPPVEVVEERCRRILAGEPLRVLYVGTLSFQKGLWDLGALARSLEGEPFCFRAVGPVCKESRRFVRRLIGFLDLAPKKPQRELPVCYQWADLFVFPTLQDGYAAVLAQAQAGALPILTTINCSGPDLVQEGKTGWIFPIRSAGAMADRLRWCHAHRKELAGMVRFLYESHRPRDWADVALDFERLCLRVKLGDHPAE